MRTAVIPAAGLGTRMRALGAAVAKELLPVAGRPVLSHILDELRAAGVRRAVVVSAAAKPEIEQHLAGERDLEIAIVHQPAPRGLGDALLCAGEAVGDEPFAVALGDTIVDPPGVLSRLAAAYAGSLGAVAVEEIADPVQLAHYGVVAPGEGDRIADVVEKPAPGTAPSRLAICGRYVFGPELFEALRACRPDGGGELQLADALRLLARRGRLVAVALEPGERRLDLGTPESYLLAQELFDAARG